MKVMMTKAKASDENMPVKEETTHIKHQLGLIDM